MARRSAEILSWAQTQGLEANRFAVYNADVAVPDSIVAAAQACLAQQGLPDVVIANAGISVGMDTAVRKDLDVMAQTFATNNLGLAATFHPFIDGVPVAWSGLAVWRVFGACPATALIAPAKPPSLLIAKVCAVSCGIQVSRSSLFVPGTLIRR